jgi:hypothetical protein
MNKVGTRIRSIRSAKASVRSVAHQQVETVVAGGRLRAAMAARVVAQETKVLRQRRHLAVPHRRVVGDAGDERYPGSALAPVDAVVDADAVRVNVHHCYASL